MGQWNNASWMGLLLLPMGTHVLAKVDPHLVALTERHRARGWAQFCQGYTLAGKVNSPPNVMALPVLPALVVWQTPQASPDYQLGSDELIGLPLPYRFREGKTATSARLMGTSFFSTVLLQFQTAH